MNKVISNNPYIPSRLAQKVIVRPVDWSDLPALEWHGEYSHFRNLYQDIYQSSIRGDAVMWLVEYPRQGVIGQLFVQLTSSRLELADGYNKAYIYGFRIFKQYRGQGIGSYMMDIAESDLFDRGFRWVNLNVGKDNLRARRLYERLGYKVVAAEPGRWSYYDDRGIRRQVVEPAWRMNKKISSKTKVSKLLDY